MDILKLKHLDPHELFDHFDECVRMTLCRETSLQAPQVKVNVDLKHAFEEASQPLAKRPSKPQLGSGSEQDNRRQMQNKENQHPNLNSSLALDVGAKKQSRGILRPVEAGSKDRPAHGGRPLAQLRDLYLPSEPSLLLDKPKKVEKKMSFDVGSTHSSNIIMLKKLIKDAVARPASINASADGSKLGIYPDFAPRRNLFKGTGLGTSSVDNLRSSNDRKPLGVLTSHVQHASRISGLFHNSKLADTRLRLGSRSGLFRKKETSMNHSSFNDGATVLAPKKDASYLEQFKQRYMSTKNHRSYASIQPQSLDNKSTESKRRKGRLVTDTSEYMTVGDDKLISHATRWRNDPAHTPALDPPAADTLRGARLKKYLEVSNIYNNFRKLLEADHPEDHNNIRDGAPPRQQPDPPAASRKQARANLDSSSSTARYMRFEKLGKPNQRPAGQPKTRGAGERLKLFAR